MTTQPELAVVKHSEVDPEDEARRRELWGDHWEQVAENPDGSLTVNLLRPKEIKGKTFSVVDFKAEPTGADVLASQNAKGAEFDKMEVLVERMTGIDRKDFRQLHSADYLMICAVAGIHMGNGYRVGGMNS